MLALRADRALTEFAEETARAYLDTLPKQPLPKQPRFKQLRPKSPKDVEEELDVKVTYAKKT